MLEMLFKLSGAQKWGAGPLLLNVMLFGGPLLQKLTTEGDEGADEGTVLGQWVSN